MIGSSLLLLATALDGSGLESDSSSYTPIDSAAIHGEVILKGAPPPEKLIILSADAACAAIHPDGVRTRNYVVATNGALANVFVLVKEGLGEQVFEPPKDPVVLEQRGCLYEPYVLGVQVGQTLKVVNRDKTLHNPHFVFVTDFGSPSGLRTQRRFNKPVTLGRVKCDVHPWMFAYLSVVAHPFFCVTGTDGTFSISGLPAGHYVIEAHHPKAGALTNTVTLGANETKQIIFEYKQ